MTDKFEGVLEFSLSSKGPLIIATINHAHKNLAMEYGGSHCEDSGLFLLIAWFRLPGGDHRLARV
jgi:hypothetical protein